MKKFLSVFLVLAMITALFFGCGKSPSETVDDSTTESDINDIYTFRELPEANYITPAEAFAGGSGTAADPYQISSAAELALLNKKLIDEEEGINTAHYILTADIALNDVSDFDLWAETAPEYSWEPIGSVSMLTPFEGSFDGKDHTVSGLYINANFEKESEHSEENYGLFGCLNGIVKNVVIDKSFFEISGKSSNIGSIAGKINNFAHIENCSSSAVIRCYYAECGGIAGMTDGGITFGENESNKFVYSEIKNCAFSGTITSMQEKSLSDIGGIAGYHYGRIESCINEGTLNFSCTNIENAGGIAGKVFDGSIADCKNKGELLCKTSDENDSNNVGGIAGKVYISGTGVAENLSPSGIPITGCENSAIVEGQENAGGIVGQACNAGSKYSIEIKNCTNTGTVSSKNHSGGILGSASCTGNEKGVEIENCENKADISIGKTIGGIIGSVIFSDGILSVKKCINSGKLSTTDQNCAGIIAYMLMSDSLKNSSILIENCENNGDISSELNAGGIISFTNLLNGEKVGKNVSFSMLNCENNGKVTTNSINGYIGGILGVFGAANVPTVIDSCRNNGTLSITSVRELSDEEAEKGPTLSKIAGGIVGRAGASLFLTTDSDTVSEKNVQAEKAVLTITNCSNNGALDIAKPDAANIKNWFGGIIGNASAEKYFSFNVSNCTFANFARGLGNEEFADVGKKIAG